MGSLFGYNDSGAFGRAYDMMVMEDIQAEEERTRKEKAEQERRRRQNLAYSQVEMGYSGETEF